MFIEISKDEFAQALDGFDIVDVGRQGQEIVWDISGAQAYDDKVVIRIYSSISVMTGMSRKKGADAIRIVLIDKVSGRPFGKAIRTHRTDGWAGRMYSKIDELLKKVPAEIFARCGTCDSVLVEREGKFGKFYGCLGFPNCRETVNAKSITRYAAGKLAKPPPKQTPNEPIIRRRRRTKKTEPEIVTTDFTLHLERLGRAVDKMKASTETKQELKDALVEERCVGHLGRQPAAPPVASFEIDLDAPLVSTDQIPRLTYPFETFNPVQSALCAHRGCDENIVVAAATSAGKTVCAEMVMDVALDAGKKVVYLSPLKAVSQEKHDDWHAKGHYFASKNVSIVTGDYTLTDKRVAELNNADVIVMTSEMLDSRTRRMQAEKNEWLGDVGVLVVDEFHLLTMEQRGAALECALMRFTKQNSSCRIVALSATMSNVPELATWLTKLNGKPTRILRTDWRPCQLDTHFAQYTHTTGRGAYKENEFRKANVAVSLVQLYPDDKFIVFVHTKKTGRMIYGLLEQEGIPVEFHSADLALKDRLRVEGAFRSREPDSLRVLVATSTLAWGINMPARRVIVVGLTRGMNDVSPIDIKQEVGRAGRIGLDEKGDSYVIIPDTDPPADISYVLNIPPVRSQIKDMLAFHVISEIVSGDVFDAATLRSWYNRTLAAHQGDEMTDFEAAGLIAALKRAGAIWDEGGRFKATNLGKIAAWLYFSPFDVSGWNRNWSQAFVSAPTPDDFIISWAIGSVDNFRAYAPQEMQAELNQYTSVLASRGLMLGGESVINSYAIYSLLQGVDNHALSLYTRALVNDSPRYFEVFRLLDKMVGKWNMSTFFDGLEIRLRYGISWDAVELCRIPGIGKKRVGKLMEAGINNISDLNANIKLVRVLLGPKTFNGVVAYLKERGLC